MRKTKIRNEYQSRKDAKPDQKSPHIARKISLVYKFKGKKMTRSEILRREIFGHLKITF